MHPALTWRETSPADDGVLFGLFTEVRAGELHMEGWEPALREPLLRLQFEAQRRGYRDGFPAAVERLILLDGAPIGWVIVDRGGASLHGIDIALLSEQRSQGVGTQVIRGLQEEAAAGGRPMTLSVLRFNTRARALYDRLGFRTTAHTDTHVVMEWRQHDE